MKIMVSGKIFDKWYVIFMHALYLLHVANIWVVFIVDNGVGHDREFRGLHIIDFSTKDQDDSNFRVLNVYTEKCQHTWNKSELRICGRIGSLVYVEVVRLGLLWMYCPNSSASEVSQHLHK